MTALEAAVENLREYLARHNDAMIVLSRGDLASTVELLENVVYYADGRGMLAGLRDRLERIAAANATLAEHPSPRAAEIGVK